MAKPVGLLALAVADDTLKAIAFRHLTNQFVIMETSWYVLNEGAGY